jgi:hypothetical protein
MGVDLDKGGLSYSGFSSQGDGASFTGRWTYDAAKLAAVRAEWPKDTRLHAAIDALEGAAEAIGLPSILAIVTRTSHHYAHARTVSIDVEACTADDDVADVHADDRDAVGEGLRAVMEWAYHHLETEYDYQYSDDAAAEAIEANEYEFLESGKRA